MRITVRGWGRDHGEKELIDAYVGDMSVMEEGGKCHWGSTYLQITNYGVQSKARMSAGTTLNLGGSYLLHVELSDMEIAQLFYQTRGPLSRQGIARQFYQAFRDQGLDYIVRLFASFQKEEAEQEAAAAAATPSEPEAA
jgi:hypothetical protein